MDPHDDPEARIRALERSLSDVAGTSELTSSSSELGSGQEVGTGADPRGGNFSGNWIPTPPPATGPYGPPTASFGTSPMPPFSTTSPTPASTRAGANNIGWLVMGFMTLLTLGIIGGAVFWVSDTFSDVSTLINPSTDRPTVAGGGGPFGGPASRTVGNPPSRVTATGAPTVGPPAGGDYSVSGVGENKTIACNDGSISISGVSNQVVITGHCASVTVSGVENVVMVDDADAITASGLSNRVTFRSGSPDIQNSGSSNVVEQG